MTILTAIFASFLVYLPIVANTPEAVSQDQARYELEFAQLTQMILDTVPNAASTQLDEWTCAVTAHDYSGQKISVHGIPDDRLGLSCLDFNNEFLGCSHGEYMPEINDGVCEYITSVDIGSLVWADALIWYAPQMYGSEATNFVFGEDFSFCITQWNRMSNFICGELFGMYVDVDPIDFENADHIFNQFVTDYINNRTAQYNCNNAEIQICQVAGYWVTIDSAKITLFTHDWQEIMYVMIVDLDHDFWTQSAQQQSEQSAKSTD